MLLFKVWNKGKTIRKAVLTNSFVEFIVEPCTPIAGHLTVVSACLAGHLTTYFFKSQILWGCPGGGGLILIGFDSYNRGQSS